MSQAILSKIWLTMTLCTVSVAAAQEYRITQVPNAPGAISIGPSGINNAGLGINNAGHVTATINWSPFLNFSEVGFYKDGLTKDLGSVYGYASVTGINNEDTIVGTDLGSRSWLGFTETDGVFNVLNVSILGCPPCDWATAINDAGQVTGAIPDPITFNFNAFLYANGVPTLLGVLPGGTYTWGTGINNHGEIVGYGDTASGVIHALYTRGNTLVEMGSVPGGSGSSASAISENGLITGDAGTPHGDRAFLYVHDRMIDLGVLPGAKNSSGTALNNRGEVVGSSDGRPFVYKDGRMQDLNDMILPTSGWIITGAGGINDKGEIVVSATDASGIGGPSTLILTPIPSKEEHCEDDQEKAPTL